MSNLESNYRLYRSYFKLPALVAYLAAKLHSSTKRQPIGIAREQLAHNHRLWLAQYSTRNGGKCEALRVMRDR